MDRCCMQLGCCSVLQGIAVCCSALCCSVLYIGSLLHAVGLLQCIAGYCSVLQCVVLQCVVYWIAAACSWAKTISQKSSLYALSILII